MEKKFEKKMRFSTCDLKYMAGQSSHSDIINQRAELARHILDCHAEIDRLEAKNAAPTERGWISSETHSNFRIDGVYLWRWKGKGVSGAGIFNTFNGLLRDKEYTLILTESDFPVPPKPEPPLEVKVGKYDVPNQGTAEVLRIIGDKCWYVTTAGKHEIVPVANVRYWLKTNNAVFIGGGDDEQ